MDEVTIVITGQKTGDTYYAKSYPDMDIDNNGKMELYKTPVYYAYIETHRNRNVWKCLRFMPYWNDPKKPYLKYKTLGWANAGLSSFPKTAVTNYFPNYGTQNMPSRFCGAIQIKGNFLIHAGPERISSIGWGGCWMC